MRQRSVQSRAGILTAAAVMAVGLGVSAAQANLVLDLAVHDSSLPAGTKGPTSTTVSPSGSVTLDVWGTVTGAGTGNQGIQDAFFGVLNGGTVGSLSTVTLQSPFTGVATDVAGVTTSYHGDVYPTTASPAGSIGGTDSAKADGWVFARSTNMTIVGNGVATLLGQLTFTPTASTGTANLTINPRTAVNSLVVPAVWQEDNTEKDTGVNGGGTLTIGSGVSINIQATVSLIGDYNHDGFVGGSDLDIVLGHWGQNVPAGNTSLGDGSGDGFVGGDDLDQILGHWGQGTPPTAPAGLSAVPEPASLGLLGLGGLSLLARRRRS